MLITPMLGVFVDSFDFYVCTFSLLSFAFSPLLLTLETRDSGLRSRL